MRRFRGDPLRVYAAGVGRQSIRQRDARSRYAVSRRRQSRRVRAQVIAAPFCNVHDFDCDRAFRASSGAGRSHPVGEAIVAQVAFADHAAFRIVLRHAVRTVPGAVLAANACLRAVNHHTRRGVLGVGLHRTPDQTARFQAMIAAHGKVIALGIRVMPAFHLTNAPPVDGGRIPVLLIARHYAALATDALGHVEVKAVLLAGFR